MPVTMLEIARRVQVSQATVSRVLSGKPSQFISESTRHKVMQAASELGYQMNRAARSLATGKTQVVALWIRNPDRPYYARILRSLHELIHGDGYEMILCAFREETDRAPTDALNSPLGPAASNWPVDGVLAADCAFAAAEHIRLDRANAERGSKRIPLVALSSDSPPLAPFVTCDHQSGCEQAVVHLIEQGCRRIAHVTADGAIGSVRRQRADAYERTLRAHGMSPEFIIAKQETRVAAREAIVARLGKSPAPDGLFCLNDDLAIGAYRGLRDLGMRIPDDVAIVGVDGIEDAEYMDAPISTVIQPVEEICRRAWQALLSRMNGHQADENTSIVLPTHLVIRASSTRMATSARATTRASARTVSA